MNAMKWKTLLTTGAMALALATSGAMAQETAPSKDKQPAKVTQPAKDADKDHKKDDKDQAKKSDKKTAADVGQAAPNFTLPDLDGKNTTLADLTKAGKIVVLQWFNPDCPLVKKHYNDAKTFNDLAAKYADKGVQFLAINSGAPGNQGTGVERNAKAKKAWDMPYPILLDESGNVGRAYGAKNTPAMVIIGKDGVIAYMGAIDDDPSDKIGKTNYVAKALDEILAGTTVTMPKTKAYGCSIKYGGTN